jgi:hypothetical protein
VRLSLVAAAVAALLAAAPSPAAEYRVPLTPQPPQLDGNIEPDEWAGSAGFDGFAMGGQLERRRIRAFVAATPSHLYFAFLSQLPEEGELLTQVTAETIKLCYDDSIEVWIDPSPDSAHGRTFQMIANAAGRRGFLMHARGNERAEPGWRGDWSVANGFHEGYWHCEVAVPIEGIAPGRAADQGAWAINLCRNWKNPWAFSSLGGGPYEPQGIRFTFARENVLAIHQETEGEPFLGKFDTSLLIANTTGAPIPIAADIVLKRGAAEELQAAETLTIAPGASERVALPLEDPEAQAFDLTLRVTSPDGGKVYYERVYSWQRGEPWRWIVAKAPPPPPIDVQFGYYPYLNRMRILADVANLPPGAVLDRLTCAVRKQGERRGDQVGHARRLQGRATGGGVRAASA